MTHDEWVKAAIELRNLQIDNLTAQLEIAEAEVEQIKVELKRERADRERAWIANWRFTLSVESSEPQRPGPYNRVTATIVDIGHADRGVILEPEVPLVPASDVVTLKAEIEQLKGELEASRKDADTLDTMIVDLDAETERLKAELREAVKSGAWLQGELTEAKGQLVVLKYGNTKKMEDNASKKIIPTGCVTACKKGTSSEFAVTSYYAAVQTPDELEDKNQSITLLHVVSSDEKAQAFWEKACAESTLLNVLVGGGNQAFVAFMIDAFAQEWKPMEGAEKGYERITLVGKLAYVNAWWKAPHS